MLAKRRSGCRGAESLISIGHGSYLVPHVRSHRRAWPLALLLRRLTLPNLMTTPPPKNMTCGSLARGAIESSPFARSAKANVSGTNNARRARNQRCRPGWCSKLG